MNDTNQKTIDVVIVNFDEPEQGLPKLTEGTSDVTCEAAQKFYEALKEKGLIKEGMYNNYTMIHYGRPDDSTLVVRNACCAGDACSASLEKSVGAYCGPEVAEVKQKLALETPENHFLLIIEKEAEHELSVKCVLDTLNKEGYKLNYSLGQPAPGK